MEFTGQVKGISSDFITGEMLITFSVNEKSGILPEYEKINKCDKLRVNAVKYSRKRSLDANAYAWALMSKIAAILKTDKNSVYDLMLQKYGSPYLDESGASIKISVLSSIDVSRFGLHIKFIGNGYVGEKEFSHYIVIKGSSEYTTKEMADFIDGIVSDAQDMEIETLTPDELRQMKERWGV
ncbi:flavin reductase (DIM6/NTAB) family NADH-FMN oxidoreductase RutF [Anaerotaenia torta]|uniref:hypothetical protein n=1 Tax=Anaerotaenia torta TaxID=433293 RepID=UPI003D1A7A61